MPKIQDLNSPENVEAMKFIRKEIEKVILPYRERIEAAIVAGACVQVATILLNLYRGERREQLIEGAVMLLEGYAGDQEMPTIILPKKPDIATIDGSALKKKKKQRTH